MLNDRFLNYHIRWANLPLAVYREMAAHLGQVDGVEVELVPQQSRQFDYRLSQIDSLWIRFGDGADRACRSQVDRILAYYGDRYGRWETLES